MKKFLTRIKGWYVWASQTSFQVFIDYPDPRKYRGAWRRTIVTWVLIAKIRRRNCPMNAHPRWFGKCKVCR